MYINVQKDIRPSCRAMLQAAGLQLAGVAVNTTTLSFGGVYTEQAGGTPFTGQVELFINQGGIRNRTIAVGIKEFFRTEVMPQLTSKFPEINLKYTGSAVLHFNEGILTKLNFAQ